MKGPVVAPINLGCCPHEPRCVLCPPTSHTQEPETIKALLDAIRRDRSPEGALTVGFFGGPPPTPEQVDAIGGLPFVARVRPDLLTRADAARLVDAGATSIELDLLSFDDTLTKAAGRHYRSDLVDLMCAGLSGKVRVVGVLAPGLPGSSFDHALRDAVHACERLDAVRIHPVLVLEGSRLARLYASGGYLPLTVPDAVTVCRAMLDVLEANGVDVIRVGVQAGPDEAGRPIAGPVHSSLRELVEARRTLDRLRGLLEQVPAGARVDLRIAPADETRTRGPLNLSLRTLRAEFGFEEVRVVIDPELPRGTVEIGWTVGAIQ